MLLSIIIVVRSIPKYFIPYIDFLTQIPSCSQALASSEAKEYFTLYFPANLIFLPRESFEAPMISNPSFLNFLKCDWKSQTSIVHPLVKALG